MPILLLRYWRVGVIIIAISVIGVYWYGRTSTINRQAAKIIQLEIEKREIVTHYEGQVLKLRETINSQNQRVDELRHIGEESKQALNDAIVNATETKRAYEIDIRKILQSKVPETCNKAIQYLIDGKNDLKW